MIYTVEILEDIQLDAKLGKSLQEVAVRLGISFSRLYEDYCNTDLQVKKFYDYGASQGMLLTDNALFELANNGSATAKAAYDKKMQVAYLTNVYREIDEH